MRGAIGIAYVAAAVVFAWIAVVSRRREAHNPTIAAAMPLVMLGACWWSVADAVAVLSTDQTVAAIAVLATFPGMSVLVAAFLVVGCCAALPQWVPSRRVVAALLVEPSLITVAAATNPWHQGVYRGAGAARLAGSDGWSPGPLYWLDSGYGYLVLTVAIALLARAVWRGPAPARGHRVAMLVAAVVPAAVNVAYRAGQLGEVVDPSPLGFAVNASITSFIVIRQGQFTFSPVARALIVDQIGDAIVAVSPAGRFLDVNPAAMELVRGMNPRAPADLVGMPAREMFGDVRGAGSGPDGRWTEVVLALPRGTVDFHVRASPLLDRRHRTVGTVFVARDVTEANAQTRRLSEANAQLLAQVETIERLRADLVEVAGRDPLTGLHNRRHLLEHFTLMLDAAQRTGQPIAVALIDVDRFKSINDDRGHLVGDQVLIALASRLGEQIPPGALVARWGGEEFFVALPGADAGTGLAFAERLRRRCESEPIVVDVAGSPIRCTLSIGVAAYPASGTTMNELFHAADVSLYEAKSAGRNTVRLHTGLHTAAP